MPSFFTHAGVAVAYCSAPGPVSDGYTALRYEFAVQRGENAGPPSPFVSETSNVFAAGPSASVAGWG